ncbi:hypothetical protein [Mixta calida]|uniref:hypothetical protein n=1 Tax=Mixta calida TaxID=665913 RepID=UPI000535DEE4|nr:hypothetical protein [Mixta calida]AIX75731.1 hypothetical protein PSNIH2_19550 [Pantoea sp. PSNIH2]POU50744.1 hypothetical protein C3380_05720 [Pantoea sp. PSNIH5]POU64944.1 hypothetical protein C3374_15445 [Pantoea sp. PSNIH4]POY65841.1 hypothetical protein C3402_21380 [Pantoea sp. PSNIH3]
MVEGITNGNVEGEYAVIKMIGIKSALADEYAGQGEDPIGQKSAFENLNRLTFRVTMGVNFVNYTYEKASAYAEALSLV